MSWVSLSLTLPLSLFHWLVPLFRAQIPLVSVLDRFGPIPSWNCYLLVCRITLVLAVRVKVQLHVYYFISVFMFKKEHPSILFVIHFRNCSFRCWLRTHSASALWLAIEPSHKSSQVVFIFLQSYGWFAFSLTTTAYHSGYF